MGRCDRRGVRALLPPLQSHDAPPAQLVSSNGAHVSARDASKTGVHSLLASPDGLLYSGGADGSVKQWRLTRDEVRASSVRWVSQSICLVRRLTPSALVRCSAHGGDVVQQRTQGRGDGAGAAPVAAPPLQRRRQRHRARVAARQHAGERACSAHVTAHSLSHGSIAGRALAVGPHGRADGNRCVCRRQAGVYGRQGLHRPAVEGGHRRGALLPPTYRPCARTLTACSSRSSGAGAADHSCERQRARPVARHQRKRPLLPRRIDSLRSPVLFRHRTGTQQPQLCS